MRQTACAKRSLAGMIGAAAFREEAPISGMGRRDFVALFGGAVAAWQMTARAQKAGKVPTIGFLGAATPATASAGPPLSRSVWAARLDRGQQCRD
jgi:hypothetical protein